MSKMIDYYLDVIKRIDKKMKHKKLEPFVKKFSGIVNTGNNEDKKSIFLKKIFILPLKIT